MTGLRRGSRDGRAGMTLIELMIALTVFGVVVTGAVAFAARQNSAFQEALVRMGALRNLRYAMTAVEQDVQTLGTNVPISQPRLIYGGADVLAFSADYATNVANDPFAVFYDPDAPTGQVSAPTSAIVVPTTATQIADSVYQVAGVLSPAEILFFYFAPDTATGRTDDFVLYRRINGATAEPLARNMLRVGGAAFFSYYIESEDSVGNATFDLVSGSDLPLIHAEPLHLATGDTAEAAWPDSIRAIGLTAASTNGLQGAEERQVDASRIIPLPNAGAAVLSTCGSVPLLGVAPAVALGTDASGNPVVQITWTPATDEIGGEQDVVRYVIWRRTNGFGSWGDPYLAIPAGAGIYAYEDAAVASGTMYEYALAAQDCTPSLSTRAVSALVTIP